MKDTDKKLDDAHSIIVRLLHTDENGYGKCYTCPNPLTYRTAQCGHYPNIPRGNMQFRWNLTIHKIQCETCNCFEDGLAEPFRDMLVSELGFEVLAKYEFDSHKPFKWIRWDKEQLLKTYRKQIRELLKDKNFTISIP